MLDGEKYKCRQIEDGYDLHHAGAAIMGLPDADCDLWVLKAKDGGWKDGILDKETAVTLEMAAACQKNDPLEIAIVRKGTIYISVYPCTSQCFRTGISAVQFLFASAFGNPSWSDILLELFQGQPCVRCDLSSLQRSLPEAMRRYTEERPIASNYLIENSFSSGRISGRVSSIRRSFSTSATKLQQHLQLKEVPPNSALLVPVSWLS